VQFLKVKQKIKGYLTDIEATCVEDFQKQFGVIDVLITID